MRLTQHIVLIGFSGSGKTTIGKLLAKTLGVRFADTDRLIEQLHHMTISEIFAAFGEEKFRQSESNVIKKMFKVNKPMVIALGGGALDRRLNRELILSKSTVFYLSCAVEELYRRLRNASDRPLLKSARRGGLTEQQHLRARIRTLLQKRRPFYLQSDGTISVTSKAPRESVRHIIQKLNEIHDNG
jgi:shikimate kinase